MTGIDLAALEWHCPPADWRADGAGVRLRTLPRTDFWQRTHYGFRRDDGHFLFARRRADFVAEVTVALVPNAKYDQAGLMVRIDDDCWLKTSCEFQPEAPSQLGAVVTNAGYSDWSYRPVAAFPASIRFRIERHGGDYLVAAQPAGGVMDIHRVAHLAGDDGERDILVGVYACSPDGPGCRVAFTDFVVTPRG